MSEVRVITDDNFAEEVLDSDQPVLVDFWAEWCGPCKMLAPVVDELANEYDGRVVFAKLDIDANQEMTSRYSIRSIPALLLFNDGNVVENMVGVQPKAVLRKKIAKVLNDE